MKKAILSVFIIATLVWCCGPVFGKGGGKGGGGQRGLAFPKRVMPIRQKEKEQQAEKGKSSDEAEQSRDRDRDRERERMREAKQERVEKANEKGKEEAEEKVGGIGREHQKQLRTFERQMRREEAKHRWRVAKMKRIRQLAVESGNSGTVERVDQLLKNERYHYEHKLGKINQKREKVLQSNEESGGEEVEK